MKNICFQMTRKAWLALAMVLCLSFPALAQKITVTGQVIDSQGEPLMGASVLAEGTSAGVATDFDGNFTIQAEPNGVLVVSYIGYNTQKVNIDGRTNITVTLEENTVMLQEVVAIGYGVVKKSDATGSVAVIKPDDIEAGLATSTQDLLVGASPGVVVTLDGGDPTGSGTIRIRGGSSLSAGNDPLIVIDGVPMQGNSNAGGTNALTMVNPQNIESMTILKDASATAIYGARASNGVIIITTKKGKSGRPQVDFSANWHVNTARKSLSMMEADEYSALVHEYGSDEAIAALTAFGEGYNTNWQKKVLRTSFSQDYNLAIGGSLGALPYRVSASYTDNEGILRTSGMQRATVGINVNPKFFNGKLSVNANVNGTYIDSREGDKGAVGGAASWSPTLPVKYNYNTIGARSIYNGYTNYMLGSGAPQNQAGKNPVQLLMDRNNNSKVYQSNGNLQLDYALHFLPEIHFNLNLGYSVSRNVTDDTTAENSIMAWTSKWNNGQGYNKHRWELLRNTLLDFYINYRKDFAAIKSDLDAMVGYSWQRMDYQGNEIELYNTLGYYNWNTMPNGKSFYSNGVYTLEQNPDTQQAIGHSYQDTPLYRWSGPNQLVSFFGRINYTFDNTYLLTFTLRDDATSRFSKDNRWGLFPSLALGWKITNMSFMESIRDVLNDAKLRLGWGVTGQQENIALFPYLPIYAISTQGNYYPSPDGPNAPGVGKDAPNGWVNPIYPNAYMSDIKWEETTTWNVGIDLGFLNNRFTAALDWYKRQTKDLLANAPVGGFNTSNFVLRNIGTLENQGFEVTLGGQPIVNKDFTWNTAVNVGYNKNKITKLTGDAETSQIAAAGCPGGYGTLQWHLVGEPAFTYRVYEQVYNEDGTPLEGQYVDQNADGTIDSKDLIIYHSPEPKATITWNNNFKLKNWDFGISLRSNIGNYVYNGPRYDYTRIPNLYGYQLNNMMRGEYLFKTSEAQNQLSSYFVENASFIRCDNITIGYTFDPLLRKQLNLRLFGAVQNPFVITNYKGIDPEIQGGIDNNVYPRPVTVTLGLVASF